MGTTRSRCACIWDMVGLEAGAHQTAVSEYLSSEKDRQHLGDFVQTVRFHIH